MTQHPTPPLGGDEAKAGRIELTSASEVFALLSSDDHVIRLLTKAGVSDSIRIEVAYALIAQRKQASLAAPVLPVEVREAENLRSVAEEMADLLALATSPDRFGEAGIGEVFLRMVAAERRFRAIKGDA